MIARASFAAITSVAVIASIAHGQSAPVTPAVSPSALVDSAIAVYEDVRYDSAAVLLRHALDARGADSLAGGRRSTALMYLGATEYLRDRRDSASAAFRRLLASDRRKFPDSLTFPKRVTDYFISVRRTLHGLAEMHPTPTGVDIIVLAINPHHVSIDVRAADDHKMFGLFDGFVNDSVAVPWDGHTPMGGYVKLARYEIVVTAQGADGAVLNVIRLPLVIGQPQLPEVPRPVEGMRPAERAPVSTPRPFTARRLEFAGIVTHLRVDNNFAGTQPFDAWLGGAEARARAGRATLALRYSQGAVVLGSPPGASPSNDGGIGLSIGAPPSTPAQPTSHGAVTDGAIDASLRLWSWLDVGAGPRLRTYDGATPVRCVYWDAFAQSRVVLRANSLGAFGEYRRTMDADINRGGVPASFRSGTSAEVGIDFSPGEPNGVWRARFGYGVERSTLMGTSAAHDVTQRLQVSIGMALP